MKLFGHLCKNQNARSIQVITQELRYLDLEECMVCINSEEISPDVKACYVDLMVDLFVNVPGARSYCVDLNYDYISSLELKEKATDDPTLSITGQRLPFFAKVRDWIKKILTENGCQQTSLMDLNKLLGAVMRLTKAFVRQGFYYNDKDIQSLVVSLIDMIDGRNGNSSL
jgi:hypothetical protein